jgi:hypothetical protein
MVSIVVCIRLAPLDRKPDHAGFVVQAFVVNAGAAADDLFRWKAGENGNKRRTRRRVSNTHFASPDQIVIVRQVHANLHRFLSLCQRHRGFFDKIPRTPGDLTSDQSLQVSEFMIHSYIHDNILNSVVPAKNINSRAAAEKVSVPRSSARFRNSTAKVYTRIENIFNQVHYEGNALVGYRSPGTTAVAGLSYQF